MFRTAPPTLRRVGCGLQAAGAQQGAQLLLFGFAEFGQARLQFLASLLQGLCIELLDRAEQIGASTRFVARDRLARELL